jgi:hypothetical protein
MPLLIVPRSAFLKSQISFHSLPYGNEQDE